MNTKMKKAGFARFMLPIGLLIISSDFILQRYTHLSDLTNGFIVGAGIGLMLSVLIFKRIKPTC